MKSTCTLSAATQRTTLALTLVAAMGLFTVHASAQTLHACVNKLTGATRIVKPNTICHLDETATSWNQQGPTGPAGPQGPVGAKGATGAQGPAGLAGAKGATGATGATGAQGVAGPAGAKGATGATGAQGLQGPAGPTGANGLAGAQGSQGVAGPTGPTGPQGPVGPTGPAGATNLPANLTALSNDLDTTGYNAQFLFEYQGSCTLGDIILSVNAYTSGAALPADGRLLTIQSNTALFSILGTRFGGNGTANFALPDLRPFAPHQMVYSICVQGIFPARS